MECNRCKTLLLELLDGLLSASDEAKVNEHLEKCNACQSYLARLRNTFSILDTDVPTGLSPARKQAMFPLVMERVAQRTTIVRRRRRWIYSLSTACAVIAIFIVSIVGIRNQGQTDFYTVFVNPEHILYSDDASVNDYLIEYLIEDNAVISEIKDTIDDDWISNSELTSLVEDLSEDEVNLLIEKLETIDLNGG